MLKTPMLSMATTWLLVMAWEPSALGLVWSPLYDQFAQRHLEAYGEQYGKHPDFPVGQIRSTTRMKMDQALKIAFDRGIRTLDIQFFLTRNLLQMDNGRNNSNQEKIKPPAWDATLPGFANATQDWIEAVAALNQLHVQDPINLRLRISAQAYHLHNVYRTLKPNQSDLVQEGLYRSHDENGNLNDIVPNLANPAIQVAIAHWSEIAIDETRRLMGSIGSIKEVSLALDAGFESSLFINDQGGLASFGDSTYRADSSLASRRNYFNNREGYLKQTYIAFAKAVHGRKNRDGMPIKAGIFQQTHHMDGRSRGTFDLYGLLKGTGIDVLHHTHPPMGYAQSLMLVAFSASVAGHLGIDFDTEFSWAHFGCSGFLDWNPECLTMANAENFLNQAKAGIQYGATDLVYCNWAMQVMVSPPPLSAWKDIIGGQGSNSLPGKTVGPQGIRGIQPFGSPAHTAIYISSWGRMECEEAKALGQETDKTCDVHTYLAWFQELELAGNRLFPGPIFDQRIDILTDAMLLDSSTALEGYSTIFLPYQTSGRVDERIKLKLAKLPDKIKKRFRFQSIAHKTARGNFENWISTLSR